MNILAHLHVKKVKLYSLFILNKILLKIIMTIPIQQKRNQLWFYKDVNIYIFLTCTKILYIFIYIIYDFIIILPFMFYKKNKK